jgi:hypothetical protein
MHPYDAICDNLLSVTCDHLQARHAGVGTEEMLEALKRTANMKVQ